MEPIGYINPIRMVIAESQITQEAIRRYFESLSCKTIPVFSGQSAWHALEVGPLPDVVILDFVLSDKDGPGIFSRLKIDKRVSAIPIVCLALHPADESLPGLNLLENKPTSVNMSGQSAQFTWVPPHTPTEFNPIPTLFLSVGGKLRKYGGALPINFRENFVVFLN